MWCCVVLFRAVLCCGVECFLGLRCVVLCCAVLCCVVSCVVLSCLVVSCVVLPCLVLCVVLCCVVLCDVVLCCILPSGVLCYVVGGPQLKPVESRYMNENEAVVSRPLVNAHKDACSVMWSNPGECSSQIRRVFIINTIALHGIGAVSFISEEKAPFSYGKSYS